MKIVHVILGKANPNRMNGVNKVVNDLATNQKLSGIDVEVWGITKHTEHDYPSRNYTTRLFQKQKYIYSLDSQLIKAIQEIAPTTVFHLHGGFILEMYLISQLLHKQKSLYVFMPHGAYNTLALAKNKLIKKVYFKLFEQNLLNNCARIHLIGRSELSGLSTIYTTNKTSLIPYGFDIQSKYVIDTTSHQPISKFIITFCGRLDVKNKGLEELVEGFDSFHQAIPNSELHIIGDSDERIQLEKFAHNFSSSKNIIFYGAKYADEKIALLKESHVFALSSLNEGLPASVLEAASLGIPSLLTQACNLTNELNSYQAGYVIDKTDPIQIRQGLEYLYTKMVTQNLFQKYRQAAVQMVVNEFSWAKTISELNKVYSHVS